MTIDYYKLNQVVAPITAAVLDMVSSWEQINITSNNVFMAVHLAKTVFSVPIRKENQKELEFKWNWKEYTFIVLSQDYSSSPALHDYLVQEDQNHLDILPNIILAYYIDDIFVDQTRRARGS